MLPLTERQKNTLLDAIDTYRSVRDTDKEWMRVPYFERLSPHELDILRDRIEGTKLYLVSET